MGNTASSCIKNSVVSPPPSSPSSPSSSPSISAADDDSVHDSVHSVQSDSVHSVQSASTDLALSDGALSDPIDDVVSKPALRCESFHAAWSAILRDASGNTTMATWARMLTQGAAETLEHQGNLVLGFEATEDAVVRVQIGAVAQYQLCVPADGGITPAFFGDAHLPIDTLKCETIGVTLVSGVANVVYAVVPERHSDVHLIRRVPWTYHGDDGRIFLAANHRLWEFTSLGLELPRVKRCHRP